MLIGIDGNEANAGERVGVNVWAFEMLKQFKRMKAEERRPKEDEENSFQIYLSRPPVADMPVETENWKYRVIGPGGFWTRWRLPLDLYFHLPRPDVFLSLSHYAPKWAPMPRVVSIMDLSFLKFPEAFKPAVRWQLVNWTRESVKKAAKVITISEFNKREIVKHYGYPEEKISVIYPGVSEIFKGRTLGTQGPTLRDKKYLLFVGTLQTKKNLARLVEAFWAVRKKFPDVELVVAGKTWSQFATDQKSGIGGQRSGVGSWGSDRIRYLGYVAEKDLPGLMAGAEALVIPSLYEGFGIPAVEAMAVGTPVLASNVTSLPEIIGDYATGRTGAGILFDPYDTRDMAEKICQFLAMTKEKRQELAKRGIIRAGAYDWDQSARNTLELLLQLINQLIN